jgi:diguanylate cyclase (GGDEF)-like protein
VKILVADDDPISRHAISGFLRKWGHAVVPAVDGSEALTILQADDAPSMAILDWVMPGMDGIEVCKRVRAIPDRHYIYLISFTSRNEKQDLLEALEAGFDDFLAKPVDVRELNARLMVGRRIIELQEKLLLACQMMEFKASHDPLTAVWNRAGIMELLRAQLAKAERNNTNLALLMVDVDHFKAVNDTYGHPVGDQVLKYLAEAMTSSIRAYDWLGRHGGEEFLIIAPDCSPEGALALAERLRAHIAAKPVIADGHAITVTVSIGLVTTEQTHLTNPEALLGAADVALYLAKRNGRNRVETGQGNGAAGQVAL